ncbi:MAG TPA: 4a-hydroxytetrahydrobiopterin dehydratase [Pseudomonadales bacterium]
MAHGGDAKRLAEMRCEPCRGDSPAVAPDAREAMLAELTGWRVDVVDEVPRLSRTYQTADFAAALGLANTIGEMADSEDHHPQLVVEWGRLQVSWWTHAIGGLHMNDFVLAARCDELAAKAASD